MKRNKVGRPKKKKEERVVGYTFTIREATKKAALKAKGKEEFDSQFRNLLIAAAFTQSTY